MVSIRYVNNYHCLISPTFLETTSISSVIFDDVILDMTVKDISTMINKDIKTNKFVSKMWYSLGMNEEVDLYNDDELSDFESEFIIEVEKMI